MDFSITLVNLAGSVALLLWGVHMVQTGVQRALGARLRGLLGIALRNRFQAFLAGIGVTAILQSSTATGLMVTGFAAGGLVDLVPALAVMLGANVGTTLIVQLLSFNVAEVAPALILVGVLMFRRTSAAPRDFGRVLIGLGLVLMALSQFVSLLDPYEDVPSLRMLLGAVSTQPVLDVILAAGLTWAAHSSVAVVLLTMSFAAKGVVPPHAAFALVLGANLGTAINPVLEGGAGDDPSARRLPIGNLINRAFGVAVALALLPILGPWMVAVDPDNTRVVADFHTGFNLILALVFFPLLTPYASLLRRLLPARVDPADPGRPLYLDPAAIEVPMVALGAAAREALRMADALESMLQGFRDALQRPDRRQLSELKRQDDVLDTLNTAIKTYMTSLPSEAMTEADHRRVGGDPVLRDEFGARRRRGRQRPVGDRRQTGKARTDVHPRRGRTITAHYRPVDGQPARRGGLAGHRRRPRRAAACGGEGDLPRPGSRGHRRAFRTSARWPGGHGGNQRAAPGRAAGPETGECSSGRRGGVSGAGREGGTAAEPAAVARGAGHPRGHGPGLSPKRSSRVIGQTCGIGNGGCPSIVSGVARSALA